MNPTLKLMGIDGNAFSIMGAAQRVFKQAKIKPTEIQNIMKEARSGDYDHLLQTIMSACEKHNIPIE